MNASLHSSFPFAHRVRIAGVCAVLMAGLLLAPPQVAAQISRAGATKPLIPGALLFGDVAHDPRNNVYLSVMAWGPVWAAFVNSNGDLISSFTAGPAVPGAFANNPRVAYSPDLNGGAGGFLVVWHEAAGGPNFVHSSVVSYPGGVVAYDPGGVDVSGGAQSFPSGGGPSIAYSPEAKKFLVTWTGDGWSIKGRLVSGVTGVPEGGVIGVVGPVSTFHPATAWNPKTQEFGVGYAGHAGYMGLVRVSTTGAIIAATGPFGQSGSNMNTALAVNAAGRYVIGWIAPGGSRSLELDSSGNPVAAFSTLISGQVGTVSSFAFALNPVSGTILAVGESGATKEVAGVELSSTGLPLAVAVPLTDGAGATGAGGSYAPRVGARQNAKEWSISYSRYNGGYVLADQIIATGSTDSGVGPPPPPPPPQPPVVKTNPVTAYARTGDVVTFSASATGVPQPVVQWQVKAPGATDFVDITGGTGASLVVTASRLHHGKLFRARFSNASGTAYSSAAALIVMPPAANDIDGDGKSDPLVWRPSNGTWFWASSSVTNTPTVPSLQWGDASHGDVALTGDLDGDSIADMVVWRPDGWWYWVTSSTGFDKTRFGSLQWGSGTFGDIPMLADMDGDGLSDLVIWRPTDGTWGWLKSSTGFSTQGNKAWGTMGDVPRTGDFDGDGRADLAVWRPSEGMWYWLTSSTGYDYGAQTLKQWGAGYLADRPFLADVDGDRRADLLIWRPASGTWYWLTSSTGYQYAFAGGIQWGNAALGDIPVLNDFDGDGMADLGVWREPTGVWYWLPSSGGFTYATARARVFGASGDIPMVR